MKKLLPIFILMLCFVSCEQQTIEEVAQKGNDQSFDIGGY